MTTARDPVLSPREVSQQIGRHYKTVAAYVRQGLIKGVRRGGRVYIRQSAVDAFLDGEAQSDTPRSA